MSSLSVAENIFLGRWPTRAGRLVNWPEMMARAGAVLDNLGVTIDPRILVRRLSVAEQQLTEIARVLALDVQILLLDEPTSALSDAERERLFGILRGLRSKGVSILYTSHRLLEIREIGDRVTVLRDGRKVGTLNVVEADEDTVVRMMVGRDIREMFPKTPVSRGSPVLTVRNLEVDGALRGVSFTVHAGEIVGIFGLRGSGRTTLARAIFGLSRLSGGEILANGTRINVASPEDAINHGIGYATEDRREGLVPMLGLPPNITLASLDGVTRAGIIDHREEQRIGAGLVEELRIQPPVLSRPVRLLSGGNQQKVVLAKWLAGKSRVLIFDEPTRGIDVGAKTEVFHADGSLAMIEGACPVDYGYDARLEVLGTEGVVRVGDLDHGAVVTCTKASGVQSAPFASWRDRFRDAYVAEARHFADCVRGEATSLATGVDGRKALEATIAANRSSRLGVPVSLPLAPGAGEGHT